MTEKPVPSLTDRQLKTIRVLHEIRLAKVLFYFVLGIFVACFVMLIAAVFFVRASGWVQIGLFLINGILSASMRSLMGNLFPKKSAEPEESVAQIGG